MRRKTAAEPIYHMSTHLGLEAHERRHRLQEATGWSARELITEALRVLELRVINSKAEIADRRIDRGRAA